MKPTKEQIQEFWILCGFKLWQGSLYWHPDDTGVKRLPDLCGVNALGNLFKYAPDYQQIIFQPQYCGVTIDDKLYEGNGETEEVAFFWAIYKALVEKR